MGVAFFREGPTLLPFYKNLAKGQLLPFYMYAHYPVSHYYRYTANKQNFQCAKVAFTPDTEARGGLINRVLRES